MDRYNLGKILHEARIAKAWGEPFVGVREPWPNFTDPKVLRAYPHNPSAYVDLALAQVDAALARAPTAGPVGAGTVCPMLPTGRSGLSTPKR